VARAQQADMPVVGYLEAGLREAMAQRLVSFRNGLSETGFVEGQNVAIEYRWAQNEYGRLPELAVDLVRRQVTVIAAPGSIQGPLAAKAATTSIPIVFSTGVDPVKVGLVASLNRPGANVTGVIPQPSGQSSWHFSEICYRRVCALVCSRIPITK
jgi:putative ABC transport system substrate-binding protein